MKSSTSRLLHCGVATLGIMCSMPAGAQGSASADPSGAGAQPPVNGTTTAPITTPPTERPPAANDADLGEILVTARRREENIQTVPVSVQAFSAATLATRNVQSTQDLMKVVPGVVFAGAGSTENTTFSIRGQARDVIGAGLPSVISYFNEVPQPNIGSILPTYDISSVQVLKGPQGTLFGRNTTGGAVLVYSQKPGYDFGGYIQGIVGDYNWRDVEGAVNLPIAQDKVALRVAGKYTGRDGYTRYIGPDGGFQDNLNFKSGRVSLLLQPTDWLTNTTVADYNVSRTNNSGSIVYSQSNLPIYDFGSAAFGPVLGPLITAGFNCSTSIDCNVDQQIARQKQAGIRTAYGDVVPLSRLKTWGVTNTTELKLGDIANFKNIFGYRSVDLHQTGNTDGLPVPLINTDYRQNYSQFTDEVQFTGKLFDNRLDWLLGGFYLDSKPVRENGLRTDILRPSFIPIQAPLIGQTSNNYYGDRSKALFGNFSFRIIDGLKLNAGIRHTWDRESVCSAVLQPPTTPFARDRSACAAIAGSFTDSAKFDATTWSAGLDYQLAKSVFVYGVVRRGYRAGGINTPKLGTILSPYQSFAPQTVTDVEIGAKTNFTLGDVRGRFNVAAFRGKFKKLQRQITGIPSNFDGDNDPTDDPTNTALVVNSGKSRVQGFEVDTTFQLTDVLTVTGGLSYVDAKYTSLATPAVFAGLAGGDATYPYAPKWGYSTTATYKLPFELSGATFFLNGDFAWIDSYTVGILKVPSYGTANASFDIRNVGGSPLTVSVFVNNLTNKGYITTGNITGSSPGILSVSYGPPRMFGVRARYAF